MNIRFIFIVLITLFFISCSNIENKNALKSNHLDYVQDYIFNIGMSVRRKHLGIYFDKQKKQEYIYFGNVVTDKVIKIFSFSNELKWEIPLDKVLKETEIEDFSIISLDTIIVLSQYTNKIFFIDNKGDVWKKVALDTIINHPVDSQYEFFTSSYSKININNSNIILGVDWRKKDFDKGDDFKGYINWIKGFYYNVWNSDNYIRININDFYDYKFGCKLYKTLFPYDSIKGFVELYNYSLFNNEIYVHSDYSNKIIILNSDSLFITKTLTIKSKQSAIGAHLTPINEETLPKFQDLILKNARSSGIIVRIFFNPDDEIYYIVILKQISYDFYKKNKYRPKILMLYDKKFHKIEEINLPRDKSGFILSTNKGLLINRTIVNESDNMNYFDQKLIFSLYKYYE